MNLPKRKSTRIPKYDYSLPNYYFITVCTHEKKCIFGKPGNLNEYGRCAEAGLLKISEIYPGISLDKYVVMPNHIHAILIVTGTEKEHNIVSAVGQYKMAVTKKVHEKNPDLTVWQRSFHDHIIRNQSGYEKIWMYIENNPLKWEEDCFYRNG